MKLRPYQEATLTRILHAWFDGLRRVLVESATGTGKTVSFANLARRMGLKKRILVLVHTEELAQQAADKIRRWNLNDSVGVEMGNKQALPTDRFVVASVQTLGKKTSKRLLALRPAEFGLIITDEAHHSTAASYRLIYDHFGLFAPSCRILLVGFTATSGRADGRGLGEVYQEIVYNYPLIDAIKDGWLCDIRGFKVKTGVSLDNVESRAGELAQDQLERTVNIKERNVLAVKAWKELGEGRQTLIFSVDIAHAKEMARVFREFGIKAEAVWGVDPERGRKIDRLRSGVLTVLINAVLLTEGFDCWQIGCIVDAQPCKSQTRYRQKIGRGTRIPDDVSNLKEALQMGLEVAKRDLIYIDLVDSTSRHKLCTLPSLFGIEGPIDLKGKSVVAAVAQIEAAMKANPKLDVRKITDLDQLTILAEQVKMFDLSDQSAMVQISEYQWHRAPKGAYLLRLVGGDVMAVLNYPKSKWTIAGTLKGKDVMQPAHTDFEAAIREAETIVTASGGRQRDLTKRHIPWHDEPPQAGQLRYAKLLGITVPNGATKGEVHTLIAEKLAKDKLKGVA